MSTSPRQAFRVAYCLGLFLCVFWPLLLQLLLTHLIPRPAEGGGEVALELGYTFTGLSVLGALFAKQRFAKILSGLRALETERQARTIFREILLFSALFELSAVYGILYFAMGGPHAERYGRSFIALPTFLFLVFVPTWGKWRDQLEN